MINHREIGKSSHGRLVELFDRHGFVRSRDLTELGIGREYLRVLLKRGDICRLSRGIYARAGTPLSAFASFAIASQRVPQGVICLLSAISYHGLGTVLPHEVWVAVGEKSHMPKFDYPQLQVVRFSELALNLAVTVHEVDGVSIRITDPARTVVDCFRYRHKIGIDIALEALRESLRPRQTSDGRPLPPMCSRTEITGLAAQLRARNVMRPYLEAHT